MGTVCYVPVTCACKYLQKSFQVYITQSINYIQEGMNLSVLHHWTVQPVARKFYCRHVYAASIRFCTAENNVKRMALISPCDPQDLYVLTLHMMPVFRIGESDLEQVMLFCGEQLDCSSAPCFLFASSTPLCSVYTLQQLTCLTRLVTSTGKEH